MFFPAGRNMKITVLRMASKLLGYLLRKIAAEGRAPEGSMQLAASIR
jgi:hypothetical protein